MRCNKQQLHYYNNITDSLTKTLKESLTVVKSATGDNHKVNDRYYLE